MQGAGPDSLPSPKPPPAAAPAPAPASRRAGAARWRKELTWRCFLVSAITIVVVRYTVATCTAHGHCSSLRFGSLAWFNQEYPSPYSQVCH